MKHLTLNRKTVAIILAVFALVLAVLVYIGATSDHFLDVPRFAWYHDSVHLAQDMGIINGTGRVTFQPNGQLTMAECIKLAACVHQYRADGEVSLEGGTGAKWYEPYLNYCAEHGIVTLPCEGLTSPISRGEAAELFAKALPGDGTVINGGTRHYCDVMDKTTPYYDSIYALYRYGIMLGDNRGRFNPASSISRAEAAAVAVRAADELFRVEGDIALARDVPLPVLMYHDFDDESRDYTTSETTFRSHLEMFRREGYTTITFEQLLRYRDGVDNLPVKPVLLISDDGYMGVLEYALPLLEEFNMNMSVAMIGTLIGSRGEGQLSYFTLEEESAADREGRLELISHSNGLHEITEELHGAKNLTLSAEEYRERITADCNTVRSYAGDSHPMMTKVFVYPYGAYSDESEEILAALGYEATVTTERGIAKVSSGGSLGLLPRITAEWYMTGDDLLKQLK